MPDDLRPPDERIWESGWEGHSRAQRRRLARLTMAEKLRWLEEAQELALQLKNTRGRDIPGGDGPAGHTQRS